MKSLNLYLISIIAFFTSSVNATTQLDSNALITQCTSNQWSKTKLIQLKQNYFELDNIQSRSDLAIQLLNCLASPDPILRDTIAYEALSTWMRSNQLEKDTILNIFELLTGALNNQENDPQSVYLPFVALVLAEVARVDRLTTILSNQQRQNLINLATDHMQRQRDYRGFDETVGWRHGIAHTADLILQLSLNPQLTKTQRESLLISLTSQISAFDNHFYIYGEPKRLAMPVIYIFLNENFSLDEWRKWLALVASPTPLNDWKDAYKSQFGLAKLHNTKSFLIDTYLLIRDSKNPKLISLLADLEDSLSLIN